jgi:hypothetical protein
MRPRLAPIGFTFAFILTTALCSADTVPVGTDDSVWINNEINGAVLRGDTQYTLPSGSYYLEHPLVIPPGASNFALKGAGSSLTFLKTPNVVMKQAIQVGVLPQLHNNWMITGSNNIPVNNVVTGQRTVKLAAATASLSLGYYILWDEYKIVCAKGPNVSMNHAEVVKVTAYDPNTGVATIDMGAGREYTSSPKLAPYNAATCKNITVSGFGFDGLSASGSSDGIVAVGVADGVVLRDLNVQNFRSDSIMTNTSRNVLVDKVRVGGASSGDAGSGYGVSIYRSRFVTVQDSYAEQCRHGFIIHSGSMDVNLVRCTSKNGFDLHGYDERRVAIAYCNGDGGDIGNDAWLGGARDILIRNCNFTETFGFHANVKNVRVVDTSMAGVGVYSAEAGTTPTVGVPAEGLADAIMFERCTFKGTGFTMFWESGATRVGTLTFSRCNWENTSTDWGCVLNMLSIAGTLNFLDCTLQVDSTDHVVQLTNPNPKFFLNLRRCQLKGKGRTGIWISSLFGGKATFLSNSFTTSAASTTFLADDTHKQLSSGNTSLKTQ